MNLLFSPQIKQKYDTLIHTKLYTWKHSKLPFLSFTKENKWKLSTKDSRSKFSIAFQLWIVKKLKTSIGKCEIKIYNFIVLKSQKKANKFGNIFLFLFWFHSPYSNGHCRAILFSGNVRITENSKKKRIRIRSENEKSMGMVCLFNLFICF